MPTLSILCAGCLNGSVSTLSIMMWLTMEVTGGYWAGYALRARNSIGHILVTEMLAEDCQAQIDGATTLQD
jgi:hypothetical protein